MSQTQPHKQAPEQALEEERVPSEEISDEIVSIPNHTKKNPFTKIVAVFQYLLNTSDDVTQASARGALTPAQLARIIPFVIGAVGVLVNFIEICKGLAGALKAYRENEKAHIRKTRIVTNSLIFGASAAGLGLSISYIVGATGAAVSGYALMPMLIPIMNIARICFGLVKESYSYFKRKKRLNDAKEKLSSNTLKEQQKLIRELNQDLKKHIRRLTELTSRNRHLHILLEKAKLRADEREKQQQEYAKNKVLIADLSQRIAQKKSKLEEELNRLNVTKADIHRHRETLLENERELSSKCVELLGSLCILPGIILGTASLLAYLKIGAVVAGVAAGAAGSVASFGALPIALIATGAAIGVGILLFNVIDSMGYGLDYKTDSDIPLPQKNTFYLRMDKEGGLEYTVVDTKGNTITQSIPKTYLLTQMLGKEKYQQLQENFDIELLKPFMSKIIHYAETKPEQSENRLHPSWGSRRLKFQASHGLRRFFTGFFSSQPKTPQPAVAQPAAGQTAQSRFELKCTSYRFYHDFHGDRANQQEKQAAEERQREKKEKLIVSYLVTPSKSSSPSLFAHTRSPEHNRSMVDNPLYAP